MRGCHGWEVMGTWKRTKILGQGFKPSAMPANFSTSDYKKINKAHSVRVIVICSAHKLLWQCGTLISYINITWVYTAPDYFHSWAVPLKNSVDFGQLIPKKFAKKCQGFSFFCIIWPLLKMYVWGRSFLKCRDEYITRIIYLSLWLWICT